MRTNRTLAASILAAVLGGFGLFLSVAPAADVLGADTHWGVTRASDDDTHW